MYPAFTISVATCILGLVAAALSFAMSRGPGWRDMRWYAWSALFAAVFTGSNAFVTVPVPDEVLIWGSRCGLCCAGLHGAALTRYAAAQPGMPFRRQARWMAGLTIPVALAALIPDLYLSRGVASRLVAHLSLHYRDAIPTPLGEALYVYYCGALLAVALGLWRAVRKGGRGAVPILAAISILAAGAINDSLAVSGRLNVPYLLDVAFFASILCMGASVASRFVASAHALEASSLALERTQKELVEREKLAALGELSAVVAHEVRNPVGIMFNALASLRRLGDDRPEDRTTLLEILEEEAQRLRRVVDALLSYVRPLSPDFALVDLLDGARRAIEAAETEQQVRGQTELDASPRLPQPIWDGQLLHQALVNLVSNALKAPRRRKPVRVQVRALDEERRVEIRVEDDGAGVPEAQIAKLFRPFQTTRPTGTGLGLALVQRIAQAHGGSARFEPRPEGGAVFLLDLPTRPSPLRSGSSFPP